ncbi:MAG: alanyl-tRNA editing protein [Clostridia bacterium]|nr:alanyl-tRNA editing protein [Clostridia bacterium]
MTERLYYITPMLTSCEARVVSSHEEGGRFFAVLDRTVIFPEGGGQPADRGMIGEARVTDAKEQDGEVVHETDRLLDAGSSVTVTLDVPRRLDHSEQHTGEHILSGLAHKLFGAKNVGFHMAEDYCTIDLDVFLSEEQLSRLEAEANAAVRRNAPVVPEEMDRAKLDAITIRKKSDVKSDEIRVVWIGGGDIDSCTCCGTHCATTGEVGYIRIVDSQKYKGGTRLWFSCGGRAVREASELTRAMTELARSYSTSRSELPAAVRKQSEELSQAKRELKARTQALCDGIALAHGEEIAVISAEGFGANDVKMLTESLIRGGAKVALAFGRSGGATHYRALRAEGVSAPMNELVKAVNGLMGGKGGGSPAFAQGSAKAPVTEEIISAIRRMLEGWMK